MSAESVLQAEQSLLLEGVIGSEFVMRTDLAIVGYFYGEGDNLPFLIGNTKDLAKHVC